MLEVKTYLQMAQNGFQISGPTSYVMTYIHPPGNYVHVQQITNSPNEQVYYIHRTEV